MAVDSKDRVYAFLRADVPILVFDPDGNLLTTWGEGLFLAGHGIYISPSDEVFLIDWDGHEVMKFDANGKLLLRFGNRGRPAFQAPFNHPADVAVAPSGEIYIADGYANSNVHRFSAEGKHLGSWGTPGSGPGQFSTPHGIWVDGNERVYVADRENSRVQIFSPEGDYLSEWGDLYHAMDIYQDRQGRFFVTDQTPRISVFNSDGKLLSPGKGGHHAPQHLGRLQGEFVRRVRRGVNEVSEGVALHHGIAAADAEGLAGDEAGGFGGQEDHGRGDSLAVARRLKAQARRVFCCAESAGEFHNKALRPLRLCSELFKDQSTCL